MTTEAIEFRPALERTRSGYIKLPKLGEAHATRWNRRTGRSFFDTDKDLSDKPGICIFVGRWEVYVDPPNHRHCPAPALWYWAALPLLLIVSFSRAIVPF